jgi:hypothetical protein
MNIQTALEKSLQPLGGEIVTIDMLAQVVVSRKEKSKVPGKPDERYMVHSFSSNPDSYGKLHWGHYDLTPAGAMDSLVEKIQKATRWPDKSPIEDQDNYQALGSDQVTLKPCELFATPESPQAMNDYLAKFSGSEAVAANTCAYMMWNLAAKLTNPEAQEVK